MLTYYGFDSLMLMLPTRLDLNFERTLPPSKAGVIHRCCFCFCCKAGYANLADINQYKSLDFNYFCVCSLQLSVQRCQGSNHCDLFDVLGLADVSIPHDIWRVCSKLTASTGGYCSSSTRFGINALKI